MRGKEWIALAGAATVWAAAAIPAAAQTRQQIEACINKDNAFAPGQAIDGCTAAILSGKWKGKGLAWAFHQRGIGYYGNKDYDRAFADFDHAIRLDPRHVAAYAYRADIWDRRGDVDRAMADYTQAIRLDPKYKNAYTGRARAWRGKGEIGRAIADLSAAMRLDPNDAWAARERSIIEFGGGDFAAAAAGLARAVELGGDANAMAYLFLVRAHLGEGGTPELETNAARLKSTEWPYPVIELFLGRRSPEDILAAAAPKERCAANFYAGDWYLARGNRDAARPLLEAAVHMCPRSFGEYFVAAGELKRLAQP
jgi:tetratricopeptide (TPR) repeat protein